MATPKSMQALKSVEGHKAALFDVPLPNIDHGEVLVRTKAVALNPSDWKAIAWLDTLNFTIGCDYAGIVEEVGEGVEKKLEEGRPHRRHGQRQQSSPSGRRGI
ncbi:chaperonin 10-like protein [Dactylonectria estremocensis]|uniref:Chaperonin 10-like protein n=1 Tax=Dactylonectria estremocensis TaxID=1079267 RepID=A0A9P9EYK7_9HYPO|nr:chaperonin 10-like protein [Dactylonectria estremocensis]